MTATPLARRAAALLGGVLATALTTLAGGVGATVPAAADAATLAPHLTKVTFEVKTCEGCTVTLMQGNDDPDHSYWSSREKKVRDGRVAFTFRTEHTHGMSVSVEAPWEGNTGYLTLAAFRYKHEAPGDRVTFREARSKKRGSACWAGTDADAVTLPLRVRKVTVQGNVGKAPGTIAWLGTTQQWWRPMLPAVDGVVGTQEILVCQDPAA